jgi:hypothetical protein
MIYTRAGLEPEGRKHFKKEALVERYRYIVETPALIGTRRRHMVPVQKEKAAQSSSYESGRKFRY